MFHEDRLDIGYMCVYCVSFAPVCMWKCLHLFLCAPQVRQQQQKASLAGTVWMCETKRTVLFTPHTSLILGARF